MIGIIIGVSSVVVIMALGDSMSRQINKNYDQVTEEYPCLFSLSKAKMVLFPKAISFDSLW